MVTRTVKADITFGYYLVLNPMMGNTENRKEFGPFETRELAKDFYDAEKVEPYKDEGPNLFDNGTKMYHKTFRKDGPLEWLNPLMPGEDITPGYHGHGIHEVILNIENIVDITSWE